MSQQTEADFMQGRATCQLTEKQMQQLAITVQFLGVKVSLILRNYLVKQITGDKIHHLSKNIST